MTLRRKTCLRDRNSILRFWAISTNELLIHVVSSKIPRSIEKVLKLCVKSGTSPADIVSFFTILVTSYHQKTGETMDENVDDSRYQQSMLLSFFETNFSFFHYRQPLFSLKFFSGKSQQVRTFNFRPNWALRLKEQHYSFESRVKKRYVTCPIFSFPLNQT